MAGSREASGPDSLRHEAWVEDLKAQQGFHQVVTAGALLANNTLLPPDHMICHGGLTAAVIDETLGGLIYMLKRDGSLPPGPAFTVHLEVDYKAPVPASTVVICTAHLDRVERRKIFLSAQVEDKPGGVLYARGSALFVVPKDASQKEAPPDPAATETPVLAEQLERRSSLSAQAS